MILIDRGQLRELCAAALGLRRDGLEETDVGRKQSVVAMLLRGQSTWKRSGSRSNNGWPEALSALEGLTQKGDR